MLRALHCNADPWGVGPPNHASWVCGGLQILTLLSLGLQPFHVQRPFLFVAAALRFPVDAYRSCQPACICPRASVHPVFQACPLPIPWVSGPLNSTYLQHSSLLLPVTRKSLAQILEGRDAWSLPHLHTQTHIPTPPMPLLSIVSPCHQLLSKLHP